MTNIFENLPEDLPEELTTTLVEAASVRIETIVSTGHRSPDNFWYDQDEHEWVIVLSGSAQLMFENGETINLNPGDHTMIPAHRRHRVVETDGHQPTLWLAVFYNR